jgi:capsular polysaccharide biosynthesis protein
MMQPMKVVLLIIGVALILLGTFVPLTTTVVTFILPPTYSSRALLSLEAGFDGSPPNRFAAEIEKMRSRNILGLVASNLDLSQQWARKYKQPQALSAEKTYQILRNSIDLRVQHNTTLIEIHAYSDDKQEAARIANMIADVYSASIRRDTKFPGQYSVQVIEPAEPIDKPFRPNKPLNIAIGCAVGFLLIAVGVFLLRIRVRQRSPAV